METLPRLYKRSKYNVELKSIMNKEIYKKFEDMFGESAS